MNAINNVAFDANATRLSAVLAQVATVTRVKTTSLGLRRIEKNAARTAERDHHAAAGTANVTVSRLAGAGEALVQEIGKKQKEAGLKLASLTTAYQDWRLLANSLYQRWMEEFSIIEGEFNVLKAEFIHRAPDLVREAEQKKGLFNVAPPTLAEMEAAFTLSFDIRAIPDSQSFNALDQGIADVLRDRFEADTRAAYQQAQKDAMERLAEPLKRLVERLGAYDQKLTDQAKGLPADGSGRLYQTVITNVQDIASVFASFNLTGDKEMDAIAKQLDVFEGVDIDDLKQDRALREATTRRAKEILDRLGDF